MQADTEEGQAACDKLGVEVLPTVQFWRDKKKLWEHRGILHLEQDLGEGETLFSSAWRSLLTGLVTFLLLQAPLPQQTDKAWC